MIFCLICRSPMAITCQERPYLSRVHPYLSLKGYAPSSMSAEPPSDRLLPQSVDLVLRPAGDEERYGRSELEQRPAVDRDELVPLDLELDGHDRAFGKAVDLETRLAGADDVADPGILEDGGVRLRRLFGLAVEPEVRNDLLNGSHDVSPRCFLYSAALSLTRNATIFLTRTPFEPPRGRGSDTALQPPFC